MARFFPRACTLAILFLCAYSTSVFSQSILPTPNFKEEWFRPFVTVFTGVAVGKVGKNQTIDIPGDYTRYKYLGSNGSSAKALGGILVGTNIPLNPVWN